MEHKPYGGCSLIIESLPVDERYLLEFLGKSRRIRSIGHNGDGYEGQVFVDPLFKTRPFHLLIQGGAVVLEGEDRESLAEVGLVCLSAAFVR